MTNFPTHTGSFMEKPFFKTEDFERICQDELEQHGLLPPHPAPVRIDRFVEKRFNIQPSYEDLPVGLLGFTLFGPEGVEEIVVSKALDEEGTQSAERRPADNSGPRERPWPASYTSLRVWYSAGLALRRCPRRSSAQDPLPVRGCPCIRNDANAEAALPVVGVSGK